MFRSISLIPFLFLVMFSSAQDAAQWRGSNRDGIYSESDLLTTWPATGPKLLWHYDYLGVGHGSAAVYGSKIYTSGTEDGNGFIIAFDENGNKLWKTNYGKEWVESYDGVRGTPVINDGNVYIMSGYGVVYSFDAENGKKLWQVDLMKDYGARNITWGVTENILIYDNFLICTPGGLDANVIALEKNTGELLWKCSGKGDKSAYGSPQIIEHKGIKMVVAHTENNILGINALNGTLLWSYKWTNQWSVHPNTPLYKDGKLFCSSGYGQGSVLLQLADDGKSVKELWRNESMDNQLGGFVLIDGKIYGAGANSKKWICLDWNTGKELYSSTEFKVGNIISAEGLLYWYSQGGEVALVKPTSTAFNVVSSFIVPYGEKQHWAHLVINNKRLFVRHGNSLMVYAIGK